MCENNKKETKTGYRIQDTENKYLPGKEKEWNGKRGKRY